MMHQLLRRAACTAAVVTVVLASIGCSREHDAACLGQFDPKALSPNELRTVDIGKVPEQGATSASSVRSAVAGRRHFIETHYTGVRKVGIGPGWGITYSLDTLGNTTFHHQRDSMIVVTLAGRSNCPDATLGTLFVFGDNGKRVPVRFEYRRSS